jgi:hypothetical protein
VAKVEKTVSQGHLEMPEEAMAPFFAFAKFDCNRVTMKSQNPSLEEHNPTNDWNGKAIHIRRDIASYDG